MAAPGTLVTVDLTSGGAWNPGTGYSQGPNISPPAGYRWTVLLAGISLLSSSTAGTRKASILRGPGIGIAPNLQNDILAAISSSSVSLQLFGAGSRTGGRSDNQTGNQLQPTATASVAMLTYASPIDIYEDEYLYGAAALIAGDALSYCHALVRQIPMHGDVIPVA
jgi:hypothetical protein